VHGGVFASGGLQNIATFDDELIARNLSPGGSADLLAVTIFLVRFPTSRMEEFCSKNAEGLDRKAEKTCAGL